MPRSILNVAFFWLFIAGFSFSAQAASPPPPTYAYSAKPLGLWILEFREEAKSQGISDALLDELFGHFAPIDKVIDLDRRQPESTRTFTQYIESTVPQFRIKEGRRLLAANRAQLQKISAEYGVPANVIVALWGMETSYGKITGNFNVPRALATLAYEGRRAEFFRKELMNALKIIQQGHIKLASMQGSWAGAMGQSQFMPSSFLSYAVDYNNDGRRDIWGTQADVFASIANYLKRSGWNAEEGVLTKVVLPPKFDATLENIDRLRPMREWKNYGITLPGGKPLPENGMAALVFPGKHYEGAYLVTGNYHVILKWNRSRYFATAVGTLAKAIGNGG